MGTMEQFDVFPGILDEHEFYSHHFFAHGFQARIKDWLQQQAERIAPEDPPAKVLSGLAKAFFQHHARYPAASVLAADSAGAGAYAGAEAGVGAGATVVDADELFAARVHWHRSLHQGLLRALGYPLSPRELEWNAGEPLPVWAAISSGAGPGDGSGAGTGSDPGPGLASLPELVIIPAFNPAQKAGPDDPVTDPLESTLSPQHSRIQELPSPYLGKDKRRPRTLAGLLSDNLFAADHPPRFVMLIGELDWVLIDRFKWPSNRALRFDLSEILGRRLPTTLDACVALLHRDALCPRAGADTEQGCLLDRLDAESHKHDAGVSADLKYALREAIEQLGNEAARQLIQDHGFSYTGTVKPLDAGQLSTECVRLVYRLIFLFYIEARPELGYVPINASDVYARSYSLEHLRDLTLTDLHSTAAQNGAYFDQTLRKLFALVQQLTPARPRFLHQPHPPLATPLRAAHRLRPPPGAARDRRPCRPSPPPDPRRTADHLPRPIPGDAPVRGRYLVRPERAHRLYPEQGSGRRRPATHRAQGGSERGHPLCGPTGRTAPRSEPGAEPSTAPRAAPRAALGSSSRIAA